MKSKRNIFIAIVLGIIIFAGGFFAGTMGNVVHAGAQPNTTADLTNFWKVWNLIDQNYPNANTIISDDRVTGAIKGLVSSLGDPYSEYFNSAETKDFNQSIQGDFGGVGIEVDQKNGVLDVIAPLKGTPAANANIQPGNLILKINGQTTQNMDVDTAIDLIRGNVGTTVTFTIANSDGSNAHDVTLTRENIEIPTVDTKSLPNGIFVILLYNFNANASADFDTAITTFQKSGDSKLILDLRGNPGGYLDSAVDIGSWFIPAGKTIVTENYGDNKAETVHVSKGYDLGVPNLKMAVLIDGGSASAAEILAGALQDYKIAPLVGAQSYGKGSVQEVINITDTTALKLTVAKWLTPNRNWISKKGLTPDYPIKNTTSPKTPGDSNDLQFAKAVQLLQ